MQNIINPEAEEIIQQARFSENYSYIIDSDGNRVELDDERIVHIQPFTRNPYAARLISAFYSRFHRNVRIAGETNAEILQYAKHLCSGRECVPTVAITGAILYDIAHYRKEDEICIYRTPFEQNGPCQNGGWPMLLNTFSKRLNLRNVILGVSPFLHNKFLGLPVKLVMEEIFADLASQFIEEARNALYCVARDFESAMERFETITDDLIEEIKKKNVSLRDGLKKWSEKIAKIPRRLKVHNMPKVLIIGGLNLLFTHYPVEKFFLENGIIPKVIDTSDSLYFLFSELLTREGFKRGKTTPKAQFNTPSLLLSYFLGKNKKITSDLITYRFIMYLFQFRVTAIRDIMKSTGLLFEENLSFINLLEESNKYVSCNTFSETSLITGRFIESVKTNHFDAIVNMGTFNCQPAMNSQAIIRPLANNSEMPYTAIDCEGPWISTNQNRLLETIAIQAKRYRENKNRKKNTL
ncbi:MAG: hypothetical protein ACTSR8_04125 [Promethearchaeota archaeon]